MNDEDDRRAWPASTPRPSGHHAGLSALAWPTSATRPVVECLVVLMFGVLLFRTFVAEAYIVPTGSMAPTLLGLHRDLGCPTCGARTAQGLDDPGVGPGRSVCFNCGHEGLDEAPAPERDGDRLLVIKHLYDWRPPRRWEVIVFQNPSRPVQAYVKRVVGRPGESVQILDGDVYIDGKIARKSPAEQRAMRILVHDHGRDPSAGSDGGDPAPRWVPRIGGRRRGEFASAWRDDGTGFVHEAVDPRAADQVDWLEYRHWDPDRGGFGPVRDHTPYNGGRSPGENVVADLILEATLSLRPDAEAVHLRFSGGPDTLTVALPVDGRGSVGLRRNRRTLASPQALGVLPSSPAGEPREVRIEASWTDRRLTVLADGAPLFAPVDLDDSPLGPRPGPFASPLAIGVVGDGAEVRDLRVYRDLYYTSPPADADRRPAGVDRPYRLGPSEFFVLGDNSPVSFDSRLWPEGPVVRAEILVGKPFLVHLPSRAMPLKVFGRQTYWIPDPREIRYIR